jgi:hypothetical protein
MWWDNVSEVHAACFFRVKWMALSPAPFISPLRWRQRGPTIPLHGVVTKKTSTWIFITVNISKSRTWGRKFGGKQILRKNLKFWSSCIRTQSKFGNTWSIVSSSHFIHELVDSSYMLNMIVTRASWWWSWPLRLFVCLYDCLDCFETNKDYSD